MKVDYDSQADALSIDLIEADTWDGQEEIDDTYCHVAMRYGRPVNVELLNPRDNLQLLDAVAGQYDIDPVALRTAAQAGLTAPDRAVTLDVAAAAG